MEVDQDRSEILLAEADNEEAESLVSTNELDGMAGEQTWPTEEEMEHSLTHGDNNDKALPDAVAGTTPKSILKGKSNKVKRKPKGMSDYMAAWIIESDEEEDEEELGEQPKAFDDDIDMLSTGILGSEHVTKDEEDEEEDVDEEEEMSMDATRASGKTVAFEDLDEEEEAEQ